LYDLAPDVLSNYSSGVQPAPTVAGNNERAPSTQFELMNDKENIPSQPTSTSAASLPADPSAPVREFLRHLGHDLESLLPIFVKNGIKDDTTLSEFKKMSGERKAMVLMGLEGLNYFQFVRLH